MSLLDAWNEVEDAIENVERATEDYALSLRRSARRLSREERARALQAAVDEAANGPIEGRP